MIKTDIVEIQGQVKEDIVIKLDEAINEHPNTKKGRLISVAPYSMWAYLITWDLPSGSCYL